MPNEYSFFGYFFGSGKKACPDHRETPAWQGMIDLHVLFMDDLVFYANSNKKHCNTLKLFQK